MEVEKVEAGIVLVIKVTTTEGIVEVSLVRTLVAAADSILSSLMVNATTTGKASASWVPTANIDMSNAHPTRSSMSVYPNGT